MVSTPCLHSALTLARPSGVVAPEGKGLPSTLPAVTLTFGSRGADSMSRSRMLLFVDIVGCGLLGGGWFTVANAASVSRLAGRVAARAGLPHVLARY